MPLILQSAGLASEHAWKLYLPVLLVSVLAVGPLIMAAERGGNMRAVLLAAVATIGLAQLGFLIPGGGCGCRPRH